MTTVVINEQHNLSITPYWRVLLKVPGNSHINLASSHNDSYHNHAKNVACVAQDIEIDSCKSPNDTAMFLPQILHDVNKQYQEY